MILITFTGCQTSQELPTLVELPTAIATDVPLMGRTLHAIPTRDVTVTPSPLPTLLPTMTSVVPVLTSTPLALMTTAIPNYFIFGKTVQQRDLAAWRFGSGSTLLMLVGGVHGGWESNTSELMNELIQHFQTTPQDILPGMSIMIIPVLNPDGASLGRVLEGRFNGNNVDLNRNWGCGWEATAYFRSQEVNPGNMPFSEPETIALSKLVSDIRPATVLFYHSAADGVFAGGCNDQDSRSDVMSAVLGEATGYSYGASFTDYPVTGTAPAWVSSLGIPSADVELATWKTSEFDRNLRGVMAIQCWLLSGALVSASTCSG